MRVQSVSAVLGDWWSSCSIRTPEEVERFTGGEGVGGCERWGRRLEGEPVVVCGFIGE